MALNWDEELEDLWTATNPSQNDDVNVKDAAILETKSQDEIIEDKIEALTKEVDTSLRISEQRTAKIQDQLRGE